MIIDVVKVLFIGNESDRESFFERAQKMGCIEFIPKERKRLQEYPEEIASHIKAIKALQKQPIIEKPVEETDLLASEVVREIDQICDSLEKLRDEQRTSLADKARIEPFGYFSIDEVRKIEKDSGYHIQFFCVKVSKRSEMPQSETLHFITCVNELDYYVSISKRQEQYPNVIEVQIEASLRDIEVRLETIQQEIRKKEKQLIEMTAFLPFLQDELIEVLNAYHLYHTKTEISLLLNDAIFAIEAWVPKNKVGKLSGLTKGLKVHVEHIERESHDSVPTYMENKGSALIGEDLVRIFDAPGTSDKDPSLWVLIFFSIFFSLIVSDAGYGAIYLTILLFLRWKHKAVSSAIKRILNLGLILSTSCIVWGVLSGSYFGIELMPDSPFKAASLMNYLVVKKADYHLAAKDEVFHHWVKEFPKVGHAANGKQMIEAGVSAKAGTVANVIGDEFNDNIFMEMALMIGVIHISISLIRGFRKNYANIGWVVFAAGSYLYALTYLKASSILFFMGLITPFFAEQIGGQLMWFGSGIIMIAAFVQNRWAGLSEPMKVIQIFSDVLSYLRLYALSLTGMMLAQTVNNLAVKTSSALGIVFGLLVVLVGHTINIGISIMGGTIHGLRLNFLEWYRYCFEGGGRLFNPLKLLQRR